MSIASFAEREVERLRELVEGYQKDPSLGSVDEVADVRHSSEFVSALS